MELIARYNNSSGDEPIFTQLAAVYELRNYREYKDVIFSIHKYQNDIVSKLDDVSNDPIRQAKRDLIQNELAKTIAHINSSKIPLIKNFQKP